MASAWGASFGKAWGNAWGAVSSAVAGGYWEYSPDGRYGHLGKLVVEYGIPERFVKRIVRTTETVINKRETRNEQKEKEQIAEALQAKAIADSVDYQRLIKQLIEIEYRRYEQELKGAAISLMLFEM